MDTIIPSHRYSFKKSYLSIAWTIINITCMHMHACVAVTGQLAGVRSLLSTTWVLGIELQPVRLGSQGLRL